MTKQSLNKPLIYGITGGIGTGKSIICKIISILGIPTYDADSAAKRMMHEDQRLIQQIQNTFGDATYIDGKLDKVYLSKIVFNQPEQLQNLNDLVHPAVNIDFTNWVGSYNSIPVVVKEAALLVENGSYQKLDKLIVVDATEEIRIKRILARDQHRTIEDIKKIFSNQLPQSKKVEVADYIIDNNGNSFVTQQVLNIFSKFISQ